MNLSNVEKEFRRKVCEQVSLYAEGVNRYRIFTPFMHDDGDHFSIVLKEEGGRWYLSDEGETFMRLSTMIEWSGLTKGNRRKLIETALSSFNVEDNNGELISRIPDSLFGDALFSFVQALQRIADVTYLSRERVHSTFLDDLRTFINEVAPRGSATFDWFDPTTDPQGSYTVDCRIETPEVPLFIFALNSDEKISDATINLLHFNSLGFLYHSIGIHENQETVNRRVLAKFTDVVGKQYSNLGANKANIKAHLSEYGAVSEMIH